MNKDSVARFVRKALIISAICTLAALLPAVAAQAELSPAAKALLENGVREVVFAERPPCGDGHWYANFGYPFDGPHDRRATRSAGGRLVKLDVESGKVTTLLEDLQGSIRDPNVHYDGKKILFSYRKGETAQFHLHEINVDGSGLKQLTDGIYDDLEATYLPDGGIVFCSGRAKRWVNCWIVQVAILYRCDADGKNIRQLSANIEQDNTPWVLPDGRIIFTRWEYVDRSQVRFHHLWTCNPDGSNQTVYYGNMHPDGVFIDAKPIPGTKRVVFIHSPGHGQREHSGMLSTVTDEYGPDDTSAEKRIGSINCRDPYAVSEDCFIIATGRNIRVVDGSGKASNLYASESKVPGVEVHEPRPLIVRKRERVIPRRVDISKSTGTLILNDVYIGRNMKGIKRGEIKKLLVLETLPKPLNYGTGLHDFLPLSHGGTFTLERILGTVPVEEDGSAHFEVPAIRPVFFIALNENNESIKRMHSFLSVMPGESLSCVGCHEDRVKSPGSVRPGMVMAVRRGPSKLEPVPNVPYTIDFPAHIQPILDKHCVECHTADKPEGHIILDGDHGSVYSHSYLTLTGLSGDREGGLLVSDGRNGCGNSAPRSVGDSASGLMKLLDGSHYEATLAKNEIEMIRNWIHIGAPYPGTYAALGTGMIRSNNLPEGYGEIRKKAEAAFAQRCSKCHKNRLPSLERYSIAGNKPVKNCFWDTHLAFNLSRPEKSALLLAPLSKKAGGWGVCSAKQSENQEPVSAGVFADGTDPDYRAILQMIEQGKRCLERNKRWDMPGFRPHPFYVREMKRYGILPETFDLDNDEIDVFETDRRYWESLWHYPNGGGPKLYPNEKMKRMLVSPKSEIPWAKDLETTVSQ